KVCPPPMMTGLSGAIGSPGNLLGNTGVPDGATDGATTTHGATDGATTTDGATDPDCSLRYRKSWDPTKSLKENFPLGETRNFRAEILNPAGVQVSRETREVYMPTLTGAPDEKLEFNILWKHQFEKYVDLAGVQPANRFTVAEDSCKVAR
ncbi:hypothetical protein THAOC_09692, partial [Thalassiosira oceanica]